MTRNLNSLPSPGAPVIAVAATSARMLAEAAAADGFEVLALDVFGDIDTQLASSAWWPIGVEGGLRIDRERLLLALETISQRGDAIGWVAGSGFEAMPELLHDGARLLPLLGTQADAVRQVRDPERFFGFLDAHAFHHPEIAESAVAGPSWLLKDAGGTGGWHIRRVPNGDLRDMVLPARHYLQREAEGRAMSMTFITNGDDARVLGFNELIVRSRAALPYVYCGAVGPIPVNDALFAQALGVARAVAAHFALRGICSLDFLLDGERMSVLEINPRPPASMALYGAEGVRNIAPGIMAAQVQVCLGGELPTVMPVTDGMAGIEIVFARRTMNISAATAKHLTTLANTHDLPAAGRFRAGDPVCSVSANGANAEIVRHLLTQSRNDIHHLLETQQ